jgi:cobalamin biosynthesis protein CobT
MQPDPGRVKEPAAPPAVDDSLASDSESETPADPSGDDHEASAGDVAPDHGGDDRRLEDERSQSGRSTEDAEEEENADDDEEEESAKETCEEDAASVASDTEEETEDEENRSTVETQLEQGQAAAREPDPKPTPRQSSRVRRVPARFGCGISFATQATPLCASERMKLLTSFLTEGQIHMDSRDVAVLVAKCLDADK